MTLRGTHFDQLTKSVITIFDRVALPVATRAMGEKLLVIHPLMRGDRRNCGHCWGRRVGLWTEPPKERGRGRKFISER